MVGTFSIGSVNSGIGALHMQLPPGATVRRAVLHAVNIGGSPDDSSAVLLGSLSVSFSAATAGPVFNSTYGPVTLHSVNLTSVLDPSIALYTLDASNGLTNFREYMLMTEYELPGAGPITVDIYHCDQDSQLEEHYTVHTTYPMSTTAPIAFGIMGAYAGYEWTDYETVTVNGTLLGKYYGPDSNAGADNHFGACATFHYANGLFEGVGDDDPDPAIHGGDALSDLAGLVADGAQHFQVSYAHTPTVLPELQADNLVNMMVVAYSASPCAPIADFLGPDTILCPGDTLVLDATRPGSQYLWQNGSTAPTFHVTAPGVYVVQWQHPDCDHTPDTVLVGYAQRPATGVGGLVELCTGASLALGLPPLPGADYSWTDGSTDMPYIVDMAGLYTLTTVVDGCPFTDSMEVVIGECDDSRVEFPNVFTPNGDASNSTFRPIAFSGVQRPRFMVYNRWGQEVYRAEGVEPSWDGRTDAGAPVPDGVYFWVLEYVPADAPETTLNMHGTVHLLR